MSWNEETKTYTDAGGDTLKVEAFRLVANQRESSVFLYLDGAADREPLARAIWPDMPAPEPADETVQYDAAFDDVKVGDRVRAAWKNGDTAEFLVDHIQPHIIVGRNGHATVYDWDDERTIDILSRPAPPKPELPTAPGTVILVEMDGESVTMQHTGLGSWLALDDGGYAYVWSPEQVTSTNWKLAKVVEA